MTAAADCGSMAGLALPNTTITAAQSVPAGTFAAPDGEIFANMPAFCRVAGAIKPTSDSNILFEVWMPASGWNQKFKGNGNGGYAGSIIYSAMASDVRLGYASASTDTGHEASTIDGSWALGHPEKIIDFGYRAHDLVAQDAKVIVEAFYSAAPRHRRSTASVLRKRGAAEAEEHGPREALEETQEFCLFLAPGMNHCAGGPGPNVFDTLTALDEWVDHGVAPAEIIATKYVNDNPAQGVVMTRPLCPYPQQARYKGTGSTTDAANFECADDNDKM